ncbi:MAG: hypothetical protein AB1762_21130, partial [Gemmatimonadota bacterium]
VVVFPLVMPADWSGSRSTGEDVATLIGSAVDGAGPLRWIDGWQLLSAAHRADVRLLSDEESRAIARTQRSAYAVRGRITSRGDSADVILELLDVGGDSLIAAGKRGTSDATQVWKAGLQATTQLLPLLIRTGIPDVVSEWTSRSPTAVAHFLLGESAFRRLQLDSAEKAFTAAVAADSTFGLAAIRGAQAATWNHHSQGAARLITAALSSRLSARHREFATGYRHFLDGRADSAIAHFNAAIRLDSSSAFVWLQLGEVYAHLLPVAGSSDSQQAVALEHAFRLDSSATNPLFHLIEVRLRQGDTTRAAPLVRRLLAVSGDSMLARQVQISETCVRRGPASIEWRTLARQTARSVYNAAAALAPGGRQLQCAVPGLEAILAIDTGATPEAAGRRWASLIMLQGIRLTQGRAKDAEQLIGAYVAREHAGGSLFMFGNWATGAFQERADSVARHHAADFGTDFRGCDTAYLCWLNGVRLIRDGRGGDANALADRIMKLATPPSPEDSVLSLSLRGHLTLARGDTLAAIRVFSDLLAAGRRGVEFDEALALAAERVLLGRLLISKGQPQRAIDVLNVIDSKPIIHQLFLGESLELRAQAAAALQQEGTARVYRERLTALRRE